MTRQKFYLTTAVFDADLGPQIGPVYRAVLSDALRRYRRMCGFDVAHFMGTEAHGEGCEHPGARMDDAAAIALRRNYERFAAILDLVEVRSTHFQRTCSADNVIAVNALIRRIQERSQFSIYKQMYEGRYCPHDGIDVSDSAEPANCASCGRPGVLVSEERYFFRLSSLQDRVLALYKYRPEFVQPQTRLDDIRKFLAEGLKDFPISRKATDGGIPWPDDPDQVVCDGWVQVGGYLSGLGFGKPGHGSDEFSRYWPPNVHVVGKESLWSHAIVWPAMLMAAEMQVPRHVFAHDSLSFAEETAAETFFPDAIMRTVGGDAVRYYLLRALAYGQGAEVSRAGLVERYNTDLTEDLGRLASRILELVAQYCDGKIPSRPLLAGVGHTLEIFSGDVRAEVRLLVDSYKFSEAIEKIWSLIDAIDQLLRENDLLETTDNPTDGRRVTAVLNDACEGLALAVLMLHPFLPYATDLIWKSLGQTTRLEDQIFGDSPWGCLTPGTAIGELEPLFPKVDAQRTAAN